MTFIAWRHEHENAERHLRSILDFQLRQTTGRIEQRIAAYDEMLRGIQGMLALTGRFPSDDISRYIQSLQLGADFSGLQTVELVRLATPDQIQTLAEQARLSGNADYHLWPEGARELYAPIVQIEPATKDNLRALGFDLLSVPARRQAMEQARDSGLTVLSGKIRQIVPPSSTSDLSGFLLALPIFRNGTDHDDLLTRRDSTIGWVVAVFDMSEFMASLYGEGADGIVIEIFDDVRSVDENRLFPPLQPGRPQQPVGPTAKEFVVIAGHTWTVAVSASPRFVARFGKDNSGIVALSGLGLGLLLTAFCRQLATGRQRAQALAETMTRELKESEACWKFALEGAGDGVWDWQVADDRLRYSDRWKKHFGQDLESPENGLEHWISRIHSDDRPAAQAGFDACRDGHTPLYQSEHRLRWADDGWRWVSVRGMVVSRTADGRPLRMIGTISDISERKATEEQIRHMAQHDPLTNLPNRTLFSDRLSLGLARAKRDHARLALMYVDLDQFKPINDLRGHDIGDLILREVAERMQRSVRDSDTVARIGGDEFVILLPAVSSRDDAYFVAEKVRQAVEQDYLVDGQRLTLSSSIGIAIFPEDGTDALTLSKNADDAMYRAKQAGRNKVLFFG